MEETFPGREADEPTSEELALALSGIVPSEECQEIAGMDLEDGIGYAFTVLLEQGIDDPEAFLREKGILE